MNADRTVLLSKATPSSGEYKNVIAALESAIRAFDMAKYPRGEGPASEDDIIYDNLVDCIVRLNAE